MSGTRADPGRDMPAALPFSMLNSRAARPGSASVSLNAPPAPSRLRQTLSRPALPARAGSLPSSLVHPLRGALRLAAAPCRAGFPGCDLRALTAKGSKRSKTV